MNSQDIYRTAVGVADSEVGTATYDRMQEDYRNSLEGRSKAMQAKVEELFSNIFETDSFYGLIDAFSGLLDVVNDLTGAVGDGGVVLQGLVATLGSLASNKIAGGITNFISNRKADRMLRDNIEEQEIYARMQLRGRGLNTGDERVDSFAKDIAAVNINSSYMNDDELRQSSQLFEQRAEAINQLSVAEEGLETTEKQLKAMLYASDEALDKNVEELIQLALEMERAGALAEEDSEKFRKLHQSFETTTKAGTEVANIFDQFAKKEALTGEQDAKMQQSLQTLITKFKELSESGLLASGTLDRIGKIIPRIQEVMNGVKNPTQGLREEIEALAKETRTYTLALEEEYKGAEKVIQQRQQHKNSAAEAKVVEANAAKGQRQLAQNMNFKKQIQSVTDLTMGLGQLAMAIQSVRGLMDIWQNDDLSFAEKLGESFLNLTFMLPMVTMGISQISEALKVLNEISTANQQVIVAGETAKAAAIERTIAVQANAVTATEADVAAKEGAVVLTKTLEKELNILITQEQRVAATQAYATTYTKARAEKLSTEAAAALAAADALEVLNKAEAINNVNATGGKKGKVGGGFLGGLLGSFKGAGPILAVTGLMAGATALLENYENSVKKVVEEGNKAKEIFDEQHQILQDYGSYKDLYNT